MGAVCASLVVSDGAESADCIFHLINLRFPGGRESLVFRKHQAQLDLSFVCLVRKQKNFFSVSGAFLLHHPWHVPSRFCGPLPGVCGWTDVEEYSTFQIHVRERESLGRGKIS